MSDRIPFAQDDTGVSSGQREETRKTSTGGQRYEEFMEGSVPCPSCSGSGRIPKELEGQLVAIIPVNDKRLRPRRTMWWIALTVAVGLVIAGLALFFLLPRSIDLIGTGGNLAPTYLEDSGDVDHVIQLTVTNCLNVSNNNFYPISVVNNSCQVTSDDYFTSDIVIGSNVNDTSISIPMLSTRVVYLTTNLTIGKRSVGLYYNCKYAQWTYVKFGFTVTLRYMGHTEQATYESSQKVCCSLNITNCS